MKHTMTRVFSLIAAVAILAACHQAIAVPTNLALSGTASANSEREPDLGLFSPSNAIDGIRSSRNTFNDEVVFHSIQSSAPPPDGPNTQFQSLWFEVDLGADYYLDRVQLFSRLSFNPLTVTLQWPAASQHLLQNFRLDVFNTANENVFTKQYLVGKSTDDEPWATSDMRNVVGRRIRLTRDPRHKVASGLSTSALALAEFEVWGQSTPILENLTKNGTVTASPHTVLGLVSMPAERAIDGNLSGHIWHEGVYWSDRGSGSGPYSGPFGNGHYWQVELPQLSEISYVTLYGRTDGEPSNAQITAGTWHGGNPDYMNGPIRISVLGADGTTVVTSVDTTLGGDDIANPSDQGMQRYDLTHVFESTPVGKFLRIEALDTSKTLSLGEVEVFGVPQNLAASIPEPTTAAALGMAIIAILLLHGRQRRAFMALAVFVSFFLVHSTHADAQPVNLSVLGTSTATASSIQGSNVPNNARDGNRVGNVIWHSANSPIPDVYGMQHWYEIDLSADYYLDRLQILPRNQLQDTVKNFRLEVYNTAGDTVFSETFLPAKTTGDRAWGTTAIRNILGSRVRIIRDPPHAQWDRAMTFAEFEVWGQESPIPENLALNRPTTSSTPLADSGPTGPELANDGDIAGHFWLESIFITDGTTGPFEGPFGNGHYWQTELAEPSAISYVNVFARADDTSNNGPVRVSILGADGATVVASADADLSGMDFNLARYNVTQVFPENPVGSYVRVESLDTSKKLALAEVEVFGPAPVIAGVAGDYNGNNVVDAADYVVWRKNNGLTGGATVSQGDGTGDGNVDANDFSFWRARFGNTTGSNGSLLQAGQVPEPGSALLLAITGAIAWLSRIRADY